MKMTASELLAVWEKGIDRPMFERALLLLETASGQSMDSLAALSIGQRDLKLLELREALFGCALPCITACPACNEHLELSLDSNDLRISGESDPIQTQTLEIDGLKLEFRLPNSADLAFAGSLNDKAGARDILLQRCLVVAYQETHEVAYGELSPMVMDALSKAMSEADQQSQLELALICPSCEQNWSMVFDITSYLWSEIQNWAMRTLREVYLLARAFGWSEADILALSSLRRQLYLQSVGV
jgi:uncharacterized protein YbaR (Trm112 family)